MSSANAIGSFGSSDWRSIRASAAAGLPTRRPRQFQQLLLGELGYHRLELEIYAFNERACVHAERAGYTREGQKRKAYRKDGEWVDSVLYAIVAEDLDRPGWNGGAP